MRKWNGSLHCVSVVTTVMVFYDNRWVLWTRFTVVYAGMICKHPTEGVFDLVSVDNEAVDCNEYNNVLVTDQTKPGNLALHFVLVYLYLSVWGS